MFCPYCGATNHDGAPFCTSCRATIPAQPAVGGWATPYVDQDLTASAPVLASLWRRFGARFLDNVIGFLIALIPAIALALLFRVIARSTESTALSLVQQRQNDHDAYLATIGGLFVGLAMAVFIYEWLSASFGGGIGKRLVGIRIVSESKDTAPGLASGFVRVILPTIAGLIPIVGSLLVLGDCAWAIADPQKQAWHDRLAGTIVVRRP